MICRASAIIIILMLGGCEMEKQPKYRSYAESPLSPEGGSARQPVAHTVSVGSFDEQSLVPAGDSRQGIPIPLTLASIEHGRKSFETFCAPCHGLTGAGDGEVVQRGFPRPPEIHAVMQAGASTGHLYHVIASGYGHSPAYGSSLSPSEIWEVIMYLRALDRSRNVPAAELPPEAKAEIGQ